MGASPDLRPLGAQDPREVLDWGVNWAPVLEPGEVVTACAWAVEAAQTSWGVIVTPLLIEAGVAWARIEVQTDRQADARWDKPGPIVRVVAQATTGDARVFVRTLPVRIARGAVSPPARVMDA